MVHAFCSVVISYIDEDWVLHEYVVDLIFFDGDHSGKAVGRLVFKRMKNCQAAGDISADPASSNGPLNKSIAKGCEKSTLTHPAREISKSDAVAMLRTSWLMITGSLGMYEENPKFPLVYDPAADPLAVVIAEMELMAEEATKLESRKNAAPDSETESDVEKQGSDEDDSSDTESESDSDDEWVDVDDVTPKPSKGKPKKPKKAFAPVDKIHDVAVHILRKKARRLIRRKVEKKYRHLVCIRSMKVWWNTTLADLERAYRVPEKPQTNAFDDDERDRGGTERRSFKHG
ncbi:hypothetical protein B0H13DRAFT_2343769 [Mycena leptocephala]|nr:hypothetical protein B0H13DRAFT_2343769 [Mycena leptocephala]